MKGFVDLHVHYVPAVDDGVRTLDEATELLHGLAALGCERAYATPHIRAGMFPNEPEALRRAFDDVVAALARDAGVPALGLGAEHFVDDTLFARLEAGRCLAHGEGRLLLVEFGQGAFPLETTRFLARVRRAGVIPVVAHPERYAPLFDATDPADAWLDAGAAMLLDVMSLADRYGSAPRRAALRMLEEGAYDAVCSDAHHPRDLPVVERGFALLRDVVGLEEATRLAVSGPRALLDGKLEG